MISISHYRTSMDKTTKSNQNACRYSLCGSHRQSTLVAQGGLGRGMGIRGAGESESGTGKRKRDGYDIDKRGSGTGPILDEEAGRVRYC